MFSCNLIFVIGLQLGLKMYGTELQSLVRLGYCPINKTVDKKKKDHVSQFGNALVRRWVGFSTQIENHGIKRKLFGTEFLNCLICYKTFYSLVVYNINTLSCLGLYKHINRIYKLNIM